MTILAVMSYQTTPWEELAKKPSIRKTLYFMQNGILPGR